MNSLRKFQLTWLYFFFSPIAILKGADLETLSAKKVRQQLEQELGVDLSDRKKEIDAIIMADVEDQVNSHSEEEEVSEEETNKGKDESESEPEPDVSARLGCASSFGEGGSFFIYRFITISFVYFLVLLMSFLFV